MSSFKLIITLLCLQFLLLSCGPDGDDFDPDANFIGTWEFKQFNEISSNIYGYDLATKDLLGPHRYDQIILSADHRAVYKDVNGKDMVGEWFVERTVYPVTTEYDFFDDDDDDCEEETIMDMFLVLEFLDENQQQVFYVWEFDDTYRRVGYLLKFRTLVAETVRHEIELERK